MIINTKLLDKYIRPIIKVGLDSLQNTKLYYNIVNNKEVMSLLHENNCSIPHLKFLKEVLANQHLTKCPACGNFNDNIECPIIRCEFCDVEWRITTESSEEVCDECISSKTSNCNRKPKQKK